jgi:hypothetical protein
MRLPVVVVMQTALHGARTELSNHLWLGLWYWLAQGSPPISLVGPGVIEVPLLLFHSPVQVSLAQDQEVAQSEHGVSRKEPSL